MLRATFTPILSTIPNRPKLHRAPFAICNAFVSNTVPVRENASLDDTKATYQPKLCSPTSVYVHLPFCRKRCHYCDFPIVALGSSPSNQIDDDPRITNYVQLICREIEATIPKSDNSPPIETLFFGGGTPSLVPPKLVQKIVETLNSKLGVSSNVEISIEMDPGTFDAKKMKEMLELGVNRVSLGVQSFQEELLKACGRAHNLKEVYDAIEIIGSSGVKNWSLDLISSLPNQTSEMWEQSLEQTIKAQPTHVSVYDLQVEQGTKFGSLYTPGEFPLPSETQSAEFYKMASRTLSNGGYNHYEISSYCKDGYECKHNVNYWRNGSFYAFGLGSASHIDGVRFSRPRKMKEYMGYVQNLESGVVENHENINGDDDDDPKDLATDILMLSLRTARGLNVKSYSEAFGSSLILALFDAFKPYVESGHVVPLDKRRRALTAEEFSSIISDEHKIEEAVVAFIRLSDPDGFLLSNELISIAFKVISP